MEADALTAEDLACPICMERLRDPFVTPCGHSFCYSCITTHLLNKNVCPCCAVYLTPDKVYPNYLLSKVVTKAAKAEHRRRGSLLEQLQEAINSDGQNLKLTDLDALLEMIDRKRHDMEQQEKENSLELLLHFLNHFRASKTKKLRELQNELHILNEDICQVESQNAVLPPAAEMLLLPGLAENAGRAENGASGSQPGSSLRLLEQTPRQSTRQEGGGGVVPGLNPSQQPPGLRQPLLPGRQLAASSLFQSNGQHISTSALDLNLLGSRNPTQQPMPQPVGSRAGPSERFTSGSNLAASSEPQLMSSDPSLPLSGTLPPTSSSRLPSGSTSNPPSGSTPPGPPALASGEGPGDSQVIFRRPRAAMSQPALRPEHSQARIPSSDPSSGPAGSQATLGSSRTLSTSEPSDQMDPSVRVRKRRFESQFEDLQQHYLRMRQRQLVGNSAAAEQNPNGSGAGSVAGEADGRPRASEAAELHEFSRMLAMFTHTSTLKLLASMPGASHRTSAAIVSSIAFNREADTFTTAGVSKRISMFKMADVLEAGAASSSRQVPNTPAAELLSRSKLSCVCWSRFEDNQLGSSDYEGVVTLWDAAAGQSVAEFEGHEKRIWSVDFSPLDANLFASGSDDGFVKVWSPTQSNSVAEIDIRANVCCVMFSPKNPNELAVGSADHNVHLYDTRNPSQPIHVLPGHRKAVSYVRYMGDGELVSASTDSTLRSWSTAAHEPLRTYSGHVNEKNFVGLSVGGNFIACGSETSEVFVYYRAMSRPIARRMLSPPVPVSSDNSGAASLNQSLQFVSSVCWQPDSQILLAATSQGAVQVLQLAS